MTFKFRHTDKIVGVFVFFSLLILILTFVVMIIYKNRDTMGKKYYYFTRFDDASNLKNRDIMFKGFAIGKITEVDIDNYMVIAEFVIYKKYKEYITEDSVLNRASNPITGSNIIFIPNTNSTKLVREGSYIPSLDTPEGELLVKRGLIRKEADAISSIIASVDDLLRSLNEDNNADANSIARILVNTGDVVEQLKYELETFDKILNNFDSIVVNFKNLSYEMRTPDNLARRVIDPEGDVMFDSIQSSLESLSQMMAELNQFSQFINSQSQQIETLILDSKNTMKEAQDVIEGIKNNPLIKGGITEKKEQEVVKDTVRDRDF